MGSRLRQRPCRAIGRGFLESEREGCNPKTSWTTWELLKSIPAGTGGAVHQGQDAVTSRSWPKRHRRPTSVGERGLVSRVRLSPEEVGEFPTQCTSFVTCKVSRAQRPAPHLQVRRKESEKDATETTESHCQTSRKMWSSFSCLCVIQR